MIPHAKIYCFAFMMLLLTGCKTTPAPQVEVPVTPPPAVPAAPAEPEPVVAELPPEPAMSEDLKALHDAMTSSDKASIERCARSIIDKDPAGSDAVTAYRALAELALETSPATARLYIERAAELSPNDAEVRLVFGKIAHAQANDDEALAHFEAAATADPKNATPCVLSAALLLTYLDLEKALDRSACAMTRQPERCDVLAIRADTLYAAKQFEDAAAHYEKYVAAACPESEDVLLHLAKLNESQLNQPKRACELYTRLAELRPDDPNYAASRAYQCGL